MPRLLAVGLWGTTTAVLTQAALARLFLSGDEPMPVTTAVHVPFGLALALYPAVLAVSLAGRSGHDG